MDDIEGKLETLLNHVLDKTVQEMYIEDDTFIIDLSDGTHIELYSDDDLSLYFEIPKEPPSIH